MIYGIISLFGSSDTIQGGFIMVKTTLKIDGMMCGMCEAHMNDTIRRVVPDAKKVKSSHKKGITSFESPEAVSEEVLKNAVDETGYKLISCEIAG